MDLVFKVTVSPLLMGCPSIFPLAVILKIISVEQEDHDDDFINIPWHEVYPQLDVSQNNQYCARLLPEEYANRNEMMSPLLMMGYRWPSKDTEQLVIDSMMFPSPNFTFLVRRPRKIKNIYIYYATKLVQRANN